MEVPVLNVQGQEVQTVELPASIFAQEVNEQGIGLMHQLFTLQMANARQGTHSTKRRGEVRGSTAKIYRQKGTGRARHGARTAPIFVGGGISMGPKPRKYTKQMPKKMRRKAIRVALSALLNDEQLIFVDKLEFEQPRTREMKDALKAITGGESALVVLAQKDEAVARSVRNLPKAHSILASYLNIRDLLKYDKVVIPLDALEVIESIWGQEGRSDA